ncbi:hypothetical protein ACVWW2_001389 [Bradyrhizobium sp. LM4.3]
MVEQAGEPGPAERAERFAALLGRFLGHELVVAARAGDDRLVEMPAAREQVRQLRPAHEGGVIAVAVRDLLHGRAEQHHIVGGLQPFLRREGEFALTWPELDLDRTQGQPERDDVTPQNLQHRLHLIEALLGEVLIAVAEQAHRGRRAWLSRILRAHMRVVELEDVEFDLEACNEIVAAASKLVERLAIKRARRKRHGPAVVEIEVAEHPARRRRPWQNTKSGGIGDHQHVGRALHLLHAEAAA